MVIFWNLAGVPFVSTFLGQNPVALMPVQSYIYSVVYMASHDPELYRFSTGAYCVLFGTLFTAYYMLVHFPSSSLNYNEERDHSFDTAMAQKSHFKMQTQGIYAFRKTFPQLPWNTVENPTYIQTAHGCDATSC